MIFQSFLTMLLLVGSVQGQGNAGDRCHLRRPCRSGLTCEAGTQKCRGPANENDPCHMTRPCKKGLHCNAWKCQAPARLGETCGQVLTPSGFGASHHTLPCGSGSGNGSGGDMTCHNVPGWTDKKCLGHEPGKLDDLCVAGFNGCGRHWIGGKADGFKVQLYCDHGSHSCQLPTPGNVGDRCEATRPCAIGLNCNHHNGLCKAPGNVNDDCEAKLPCKSGLRCESGSCKMPDDYVPAQCKSSIDWALRYVRSGNFKPAEADAWYSGMLFKTGVAPSNAQFEDFQRIFKCNGIHKPVCNNQGLKFPKTCTVPPCDNCKALATDTPTPSPTPEPTQEPTHNVCPRGYTFSKFDVPNCKDDYKQIPAVNMEECALECDKRAGCTKFEARRQWKGCETYTTCPVNTVGDQASNWATCIRDDGPVTVPFSFVADSTECGNKITVLSRKTSDPAECAALAKANPGCGSYFEVRKDKLRCRCQKANKDCVQRPDSGTVLYKLDTCVVTLYEHGGFGGSSKEYSNGQFPVVWKNDRLSSLKVSTGCVAKLYEDVAFAGRVVSVAAGEYDLEDLERVGVKNDRVSSLKVEEEDADRRRTLADRLLESLQL